MKRKAKVEGRGVHKGEMCRAISYQVSLVSNVQE